MRAPAAFLLAVLGAASTAPAIAEEIGHVARLSPKVLSYPPGQPSRDLRQHDPVERGLKVRLAELGSYLKIAFNFGGTLTQSGPWTGRITGVATFRGKGEADIGDPGRPSDSVIKVYLGRLWLALLPGSSSPFEVDTPHAAVRAEGTYFRIFVDPATGTFVAVDEGAVRVAAKAGGEEVRVTAGRWVLIPPGGQPTPPALLEPLDKAAGGDVLESGTLEDALPNIDTVGEGDAPNPIPPG